MPVTKKSPSAKRRERRKKANKIPGVLWADQYQLTMAQAFYDEKKKKGDLEQEASCELYFRKHPFEGGYAVSCGIHDVIEHLNNLSFNPESIAYLRGLKNANGTQTFSEEFLAYLVTMKFKCSIDAVPDGTIVFANEPLIRVTGPIIQAQMIESALLNMMGPQTLIATKASRVKTACGDKKLLEFGLRRAQGKQALESGYAAHVGGADATSNLAASYRYRIPASGTFGHVWVMAHGGPDEELGSFRAFAESMPDNATFLVDSFDSIDGAFKAIIALKEHEKKGHRGLGIRLDSGDLAVLSKQIRELLDAADLSYVKILATNDLDEHLIGDLVRQGACIDIYGVGTNLITGGKQPALGCVYKVNATRTLGLDEEWVTTMKLSESHEKTTTPGRHGVRRYFRKDGKAHCDAIYDVDMERKYDSEALPEDALAVVNPRNPQTFTEISAGMSSEELLVPIFIEGDLVYTQTRNAQAAHARAAQQRGLFGEDVLRLQNPAVYPANLRVDLAKAKSALISEIIRKQAKATSVENPNDLLARTQAMIADLMEKGMTEEAKILEPILLVLSAKQVQQAGQKEEKGADTKKTSSLAGGMFFSRDSNDSNDSNACKPHYTSPEPVSTTVPSSVSTLIGESTRKPF